MKGAMVVMTVLWGLSFAFPANGSEVRTACPQFKPWDSRIAFHYGKPEPRGIPEHLEEDRITRRNGLVYLEFDFESENHDRAYLTCEYKDRTRIDFPIPGLLLRCGMTIRHYDSRTKPTEWLDVWCISDDEREASPAK